MQRYLNSKTELELFYMGLLLGKELDVTEEWRTKDAVGFGDFEGLHIHLCLHSLSLDFDQWANDAATYYAALGIAHEASERVQEWLSGSSSEGGES